MSRISFLQNILYDSSNRRFIKEVRRGNPAEIQLADRPPNAEELISAFEELGKISTEPAKSIIKWVKILAERKDGLYPSEFVEFLIKGCSAPGSMKVISTPAKVLTVGVLNGWPGTFWLEKAVVSPLWKLPLSDLLHRSYILWNHLQSIDNEFELTLTKGIFISPSKISFPSLRSAMEQELALYRALIFLKK